MSLLRAVGFEPVTCWLATIKRIELSHCYHSSRNIKRNSTLYGLRRFRSWPQLVSVSYPVSNQLLYQLSYVGNVLHKYLFNTKNIKNTQTISVVTFVRLPLDSTFQPLRTKVFIHILLPSSTTILVDYFTASPTLKCFILGLLSCHRRKTSLTVYSISRITKRTVQRHACAVVTPLSTKAPIFDKPSGDDGNLCGEKESNLRFYLEMVNVKALL